MTETVNPPVPSTKDVGLDIFAEFAVQDEGVWFPYKGDVEFCIARANNPAYRRRVSYLYEKNRRVLDGKGAEAQAKSDEITAIVMGETILMGWKGTVSLKGEVLPYSKANAIKLLSVPLFREWVHLRANDEQEYKLQKDEEDHENL